VTFYTASKACRGKLGFLGFESLWEVNFVSDHSCDKKNSVIHVRIAFHQVNTFAAGTEQMALVRSASPITFFTTFDSMIKHYSD